MLTIQFCGPDSPQRTYVSSVSLTIDATCRRARLSVLITRELERNDATDPFLPPMTCFLGLVYLFHLGLDFRENIPPLASIRFARITKRNTLQTLGSRKAENNVGRTASKLHFERSDCGHSMFKRETYFLLIVRRW